ncbi:multidrug efflux RND transporter permease subunit [Chitiniphilus shinanonensis]|uniref:Efflux pump membrane transporter n=1 Tax=Chitiniphilus shinanonensis TaxID=553088 RepID=A0ABQ6BU77_9NEIS|nr:efflux RND transporter permease subunit [Chitiniphilus shinanonensis]GLS03354.1 multidrug efflux RND transporter permease subunit [Chitiniphilus shinanonensis]
MFARFFIDRPIFAWVIAIIIVLAGVLALRGLPVAQYPEVAPPGLTISTSYPGASAKVVEETVTSLIEQEMNGIENLLYMSSESDSSGNMSISLTFQTGTNLDIASVEAQNRVKRVEARLPEEVRQQGVQVLKSRDNYLLFITLFSPDGSYDETALGSYVNANVIDALRRVPGVGEAQLFGSEYAMRIWLDPAKLAGYHMSPSEALAAVRAQNVQLATGEIGQLPAPKGQQFTATVVTQGRFVTPEEFGNIALREGDNGALVRLKDVARVELGAAAYDVEARLNGKPIAAIGMKLSPDGNAVQTSAAIRAKMAELAKYFPKNQVDWEIPYDTSKFIDISIKEVLKTLAEAIVLVFIVMYLFLGNLRATLIPTIVVPIALTGALLGLYLFDYSINVLTMFAMVLAIGILVDDAIVVIENVERIMSEEGLAPREATQKAMGQIVSAIIAITLVLTAVFIPMAFFTGSVGAIYRQFSVTLVLTMFFSALMALTLTPALCATLLKPVKKGEDGHGTKGFFGWFNRKFASVSHGYQGWVARILRRTGLSLVFFALILAATGWLFTKLPTSFLPEEDQGYFINIVQLPAGATRERTLEVVKQVEQHFIAQPAVARVVSVVGFSFFGRGQNAALAFVTLKDWDERHTAESQLDSLVGQANMMLFRIKQAFIFSTNVPPIPELASVGGFDFRLQDRGGIGREQLLQARNMLLGMAGQNPNLAGVRPEGQEPGPQLYLDVDKVKASQLGIDMAELNSTLAIALGSAYANDFVREGRVLRVLMQAAPDARTQPEDILRLQLKKRDGSLVPFSEIATTRWVVGEAKLDRYNGVPSYKIAGGPAPGKSSGDAMDAMEDMAAKLPPGVGFEWSGTSYEERLSGTQAPMLFALSILVVFLCLAALYESWSIPFAVLWVVPLGIFGAVVAMTLRGLPNDVYFKVGLIAIIGLSAKNAILIIEFAREMQRHGMNVVDATLEACRLRFRPILMTSIAFIAGVMPLAISSGAGAASRHALGTGVVGGMIAATVLAVFLVPVFFVVVRRFFPDKSGPLAGTDDQPADDHR